MITRQITRQPWNSPENDEDWDTLKLDGQAFPGLARVDVNLPIELDIQKGASKRKARVKDPGEQPWKLTITIRLWTKEHKRQLKAMLPLLVPKSATSSREGRTIVHPNANFWGIDRVVLGPIKSQQPTGGGPWTIEIDAVEWTAAPKAVKKSSVDAAKAADEKAWRDYLTGEDRSKQTDQFGYRRMNRSREEAPPGATDAAAANLLPSTKLF